jgi:hypothetical protein
MGLKATQQVLRVLKRKYEIGSSSYTQLIQALCTLETLAWASLKFRWNFIKTCHSEDRDGRSKNGSTSPVTVIIFKLKYSHHKFRNLYSEHHSDSSTNRVHSSELFSLMDKFTLHSWYLLQFTRKIIVEKLEIFNSKWIIWWIIEIKFRAPATVSNVWLLVWLIDERVNWRKNRVVWVDTLVKTVVALVLPFCCPFYQCTQNWVHLMNKPL